MTNLTGFGLAAAINGAIALLVLSLFLCARKRPANRFVYAPRTLLPQFRQGRPEPPPLPDSYLSWLWAVWRISRDDFIAYAGLDAYMFCRFCMLCVELFAAMTVLGVAVLVPVNYTSDRDTAPAIRHRLSACLPAHFLRLAVLVGAGWGCGCSGENDEDGFDAISMSNVPERSSRLAAHVIVSYCFAAWTYWQLWRCWSEYTELRLAYMAQEHLHNRSLTLLVQNIPSRARTDAAFLNTFRSFFPIPASPPSTPPMSPRTASTATAANEGHASVEPHFIHSAYIAKDVGDMPDHIADRDAALEGMEKAVAAYRDKPDERPTTATKLFCLNKRDALEYHEEEIHKNNALLAEGRHQARTSKRWANGFITFDSVMAYQSALRVDASTVPFEWQCKPAPELRDVYWPSLSLTATQRVTGNIIALCLLWALVLLWLIPVTFIQSLANLSTLPGKVHFLSFINDIPSAVLGIIDGFLPPLVLTIFNILLPKILAAFTKLQGPESTSRLQNGVLHKFSVFWILNYLIFSTVATSIFNQLSALIDDPSSIVTLLGQSIPSTSTFFITYLLFQTFSSYPMQLLNPGRLIVSWLKKRFTVKVPRDIVKIEAAPAQDYGTAYPMLIFAFAIAVTFAVLAPIVLPFAALYFLSAFLCYKYQYIYYYNTAFETGGQFWPNVHLCLVWCLFVAQLVFTILLGLKKSAAAAVISAPLIIAPWLWRWFANKAFKRRTQLLPLDIAVHIDTNREQRRLMRYQQQHDEELRGRSLAFLDEASNVRNFGYDTAELRAMRQDDITLPHNTPSQRRTEQYHAAIVREQKAALNGRKAAAADGGAATATGTATAAALTATDAILGNGDGDIVGGEADDDYPTTQFVVSPLPLQTARSSLSMGQSGLVEYRSQHRLLDRVLQAASQLGPLLPPQDYIQPALLVPDQLPIPRSMPAVTRQDSLADKPELYDEITEAGLLRHAGGDSEQSPRKQQQKQRPAALNGADKRYGAIATGTEDDSPDGSGVTHSLIRQPTPARQQQQQQQHQAPQPLSAESAPAQPQQASNEDDPDEIVVHR